MRTKHFIPLSILLFAAACNDQATIAENNTNDSISNPVESAKQLPNLVVANSEGGLLLTAENGAATGPEIKYMPEWKAFGWFGGKDQVQWEVEAPAAGIYEAFMEWSVSPEEAGKEYVLEAKDKKLVGKVKSSGSWETFSTEKIGQIELNKGQQSIIFKPNVPFEKGAILDLRQIKLSPIK